MTISTPHSAATAGSISGELVSDHLSEKWNCDVVVDPVAAQSLWDALNRARAAAPVISKAEDAVFRLYLPVAQALARSRATQSMDPDVAEQAAELGLAKAVLAWRRTDSAGFAAFAQAAVQSQIQHIQLVLAGDRSRREGGPPHGGRRRATHPVSALAVVGRAPAADR